MNLNGFPSKSYEPLIFPVGQEPAHGERRHGGHLRQRLLRDLDFEMAVHFLTYLVKQTNQPMSQSWRNRFRRHFTKTAFQLLKALFKEMLSVRSKGRETL